MRARVYERLSPRPCTFNFVCVPKCVYLWPVLRFRFASSVFLAVSFFSFFFTLTRVTLEQHRSEVAKAS